MEFFEPAGFGLGLRLAEEIEAHRDFLLVIYFRYSHRSNSALILSLLFFLALLLE